MSDFSVIATVMMLLAVLGIGGLLIGGAEGLLVGLFIIVIILFKLGGM